LPSETDEAVKKRRARQQRNKDLIDYSIKRLFKSPQRSLNSRAPQFKWGDIVKHAAVKGERWMSKNVDNTYRINKLFRHNEKNYRIEKVREYYNHKYKTNRSEWKTHGNVDIFQLQNVLRELVNRMTEHLQDNSKL